ncbi:uncharacterized protein LOC144875911 [Branchiostoma floridae x Branchiostoma japonicum]
MSQGGRSLSPDGASASAPQKPKNGNRKPNDDDDDKRSILVSNIPPTLTDDKVMIHFQRSSSGGGDVRQVRRLSPSQAKVIFEDVEVIHRVVARKHELDGVTLHVEAWSSFLVRALEMDRASHGESNCVQATVQLHQLVTQPVWDSYKQKMSNVNVKLNRSTRNDVVTLKGSWNDVVEAKRLLFDLLSEVDEAESPSTVDSKKTGSRNGHSEHQTEEGVANNMENHHTDDSQHQQQAVVNNGTEIPDEDYLLERLDLDRKEREGASSSSQLQEGKEKRYSASNIRSSSQDTKIDESRLDNLRGFDRSHSLESREDDRLKEATGDGTQSFKQSMSAPYGASSTYGSSKTRATRPQQDTTPPHQFSEPLREEPNSRHSFESKMSEGATSTLHNKTASVAEESRGGQSLSHPEGRTRPGGMYKLADMSDDEDDDVINTSKNESTVEQPVEPDILSYIIKVHRAKILAVAERHKVTFRHNEKRTVVYFKGPKKNAENALEDFITMYQGLFGKIKSISLDTNMHNHVKSDVCSYAVQIVQKSSPSVFIKNTDGNIVFIGDESEVRSARAEVCSFLKISESRRRKSHTSSAPTSPTVLGPGQASATAILSNLSSGDKLVFLDKIKGIQICVVEGDITQQKVDVIVNAANNTLNLNWGVSGAISKAGGSSIQAECNSLIRGRGYLNTTDCVWTTGGRLPCKFVIHAVSPIYSAAYGSHKCQQELHDTCHKVLRMASDLKAGSIAMPAISSGACGMPRDLCAESMFSAITDFIENVNPRHNTIVDIRIIDNDRKAAEVFSEIFSKMSARFKATHVTNPNLQPRYPPSGPPSSPGTSGTTAVSHGTSQTSPAFQVSSSSSSGVGSVSYPGPTQEYVAAVSSYPHDKSTATSYLHSTPGYPGSGDLTQTYPGASGTQPSQSHSTYWQTQPSNSRNTSSFSSPRASSASSASGSSDKGDTCPICLCDFTGPVTTTRCKHEFCTDCLDSALKLSGQCPICKAVIGRLKGNQPPGTMTHRTDYINSLPGYESYSTIEIHYEFRSGIQGPEHPNPGKHYTGTSRRAYLPDNSDGQEVLRLLKRAFDSRLVFTIGTSATTGLTDTVVWNDIHHKTSKYGGPNSYGYPDPQYLTRVKEELAAKGIN